MGFLVCHAKYLIDKCKENSISGDIITFGRFDFFFGLEEFYALMIAADYARIENGKVVFADPETEARMEVMRQDGRHLNQQFNYTVVTKQKIISDEFFYAGLGFRTFHFLDISDRDGALSFNFDLNQKTFCPLPVEHTTWFSTEELRNIFSIHASFFSTPRT